MASTVKGHALTLSSDVTFGGQYYVATYSGSLTAVKGKSATFKH